MPTQEQALVSEIEHDQDIATIAVLGVPCHGAALPRLVGVLAHTRVRGDLVAHVADADRLNTTFTVARADGPRVMAALIDRRVELGFQQLVYDQHLDLLGLRVTGLGAQPALAARFCETLAAAGVTFQTVSRSSTLLSVLCQAEEITTAIRSLRDVFGPHLPVRRPHGGGAAPSADQAAIPRPAVSAPTPVSSASSAGVVTAAGGAR